MIAKKVEFVSASEAEIGNDAVVMYLQSDTIDELQDASSDWGAGFTVGNESSDTRQVDIQLLKGGVAHEAQMVVMGWVSLSEAGQPTAIDGVVTVGPGRVLILLSDGVSGNVFWLETNSAGTVTIALNNEDTETIYLNLVMPDGSVVSSSGIAFA